MNKRLRFALVILVLAVVGLAAWSLLRSREPVYKGKRLSEWTELLATMDASAEEISEATAAVRYIGTNAISFFLADLQAKRLPWEPISPWLDRWSPISVELPTINARRARGFKGFEVLGSTAEPALQRLQELMGAKDNEMALLARYALGAIGTDEAVSVLTCDLTNANLMLRLESISYLGSLQDRALPAIPALVTNLESGDPLIRRYAAFALGNLRSAPQLVVPALVNRTGDRDRKVQSAAINALGKFGSEAVAAIPALEELAQTGQGVMPHRARQTLNRIKSESRDGGVVRGPKDEKKIALVFTGHEYAEGAETILTSLAKHHAKASLFLTGDFLANTNFSALIQRAIDDKHLIGPHSDKHLLYCSWGDRKTLVSREAFRQDLQENQNKIFQVFVKNQIPPGKQNQNATFPRYGPPVWANGPPEIVDYQARYFLPPFEYYNPEIVRWTMNMGLTLINFTPGTRSNADYTGEADKNFVSSQVIFDSIVKKEREDPHGLNGFILLLHLGAGPGRKDKFHHRFGELLDYLAGKGYQFVRVDELLEPKPEKNPQPQSPQVEAEASQGEKK